MRESEGTKIKNKLRIFEKNLRKKLNIGHRQRNRKLYSLVTISIIIFSSLLLLSTPAAKAATTTATALHVNGPLIQDSNGNTIILRGQTKPALRIIQQAVGNNQTAQ